MLFPIYNPELNFPGLNRSIDTAFLLYTCAQGVFSSTTCKVVCRLVHQKLHTGKNRTLSSCDARTGVGARSNSLQRPPPPMNPTDHRKPFVAQGQTSSRSQKPETSKFENHIRQHAPEPFRPNGLLTADSSKSTDQSSPPQDMASSGSLTLNGVNKPLNISSFANSKLKHSRSSFENMSSRSHSPRPNFAQPIMRMPVPSAGFAAPSGFASVSFPRAHGSYNNPTSANEFSSNKAHTPTLHPDPDDEDDLSSSHFESSSAAGLRRISSRPSLERIQEDQEEEGSGEHRYETNLNHRREQPEEHASDRSGFREPFYSSASKPPLRRIQKRIECPEDESDVFSSSKRHKGEEEVGVYRTIARAPFHRPVYRPLDPIRLARLLHRPHSHTRP